jgi:hypothetical protein
MREMEHRLRSLVEDRQVRKEAEMALMTRVCH